jgi:hypothetical protein
MFTKKLLQKAAVGLACLGLLCPQARVMADSPQDDAATARSAAQPAKAKAAPSPLQVSDVALTADGRLIGQVTDAAGNGLEKAPVSVRQGRTEIARTTSDANGTFVVDNLNSGIYQVVAGRSVGLFRVWSERTAPPAAQPVAQLSGTNQTVIRAQDGYYDYDYDYYGGGIAGLDLLTITLLGTTIAALTLSALTYSKVKDLEGQLNTLSSSPPAPATP